jgi:hypothetical protein
MAVIRDNGRCGPGSVAGNCSHQEYEVSMAAFCSAWSRQGEASFHDSRIEPYPGEIDMLW